MTMAHTAPDGYALVAWAAHSTLCSCECFSMDATTAKDQLSQHYFTFTKQRWTHDLFSCPGRPPHAAETVYAVPPYPSPMPYDEAAVMMAANGGVQLCWFRLAFSGGSASDPLVSSLLQQRMARMRRPPIVHLRWLSSSWWCVSPDVIAIDPTLEDHPSQACRSRHLHAYDSVSSNAK